MATFRVSMDRDFGSYQEQVRHIGYCIQYSLIEFLEGLSGKNIFPFYRQNAIGRSSVDAWMEFDVDVDSDIIRQVRDTGFEYEGDSYNVDVIDSVKSFTIDDIRRGEDDNFIHHREYTNQLGKASLSRVYGSTAEFKTYSSKYKENHTRWVQRVQFEDFLELAKDKDISIDEAVDLVIDEGDVRVSCNCPAFLYWGYAYIDWQLDFEQGKSVTIAPDVRNPNRRGVVCKHLSRVLERFSEHGFNDSLKRLFKTKYGSKYDGADGVESALKIENKRFYRIGW